jgi:hypothetical protein
MGCGAMVLYLHTILKHLRSSSTGYASTEGSSKLGRRRPKRNDEWAQPLPDWMSCRDDFHAPAVLRVPARSSVKPGLGPWPQSKGEPV